jgi:phosphatidylserine/phosphatidylglycerophosphate/cardiolipin synthase-like enzyme
MYRTALAVLGAAALAAGLSSCKITLTQPGAQSPASAPGSASSPAAPATTTAAPAPAAGGAGLTVLTEPQAGIGPVYRLLTSARHSVDLTMYELRDPTAEADLAADAARRVDVRVILDRHLEESRNRSAYDYLAAHHVHVTWAPDGTTYHQKTLTIDNATSMIMTLNLVSEDYAGTRDFAVTDTRRQDVAAIVATFNADFAGRKITPPDGTGLVWSPTNSESSMLAVIHAARHSLAVENEEMGEGAITSALAAAARRGVDVTVTMTRDSEWYTAFSELARAGVHIRLYPDSSRALYIHAKAIVADAGRPGQQVLVGSENFSVASLGYNRELGLRTASRAVVAAIGATLARDYAGATPYSP